jgi:hypothetical protein
MSAAAEILSELARRGVMVRAEGEILRLKPKSALDDELLVHVREQKPEIIKLLLAAAPCGSPHCGGCYSVGVIDGKERFLHPPKISEDYKKWLERWDPGKRDWKQ